MEDRTVGYVYQQKQGKTYVTTHTCEDSAQTYNDLAHELIAKKINECRWIRSIQYKNLFDGFVQVTVIYDHGGRRVYTITRN